MNARIAVIHVCRKKLVITFIMKRIGVPKDEPKSDGRVFSKGMGARVVNWNARFSRQDIFCPIVRGDGFIILSSSRMSIRHSP